MMQSHQLAVGQAAEIAHAYRFLIVVCFIIGHALHIAGQADGLAKAHPDPKVSDWFVVRSNAVPIAWRSFASLAVFFGIWQNPAGIVALFGYAGFTLGQNASAILTFPMSPWFAAIWGLGLDWALSNFPKLKSVIPVIEFTREVKNVHEVTTKDTRTVTETPPVIPAVKPEDKL